MLDISRLELASRAAEQVLAHKLWRSVDEGHHVLQLVAETEGASWLVVSVPRPKAARKGLVQEPAISQNVEGLVGGFHMNRTERLVPVLPHRFESAARRDRSPEAMCQVVGIIGIIPYTEPEDELTLFSIG
jgi:hypothetical protein